METEEERKIWDEQKSMSSEEKRYYKTAMTREEIVEDAGLDINIDDINKVDTGFEDVDSLKNEDKKIVGTK